MIHLQGLKFCKHAQGNFALTCKSSETSEWVEGIYLFRESGVEPGSVQFSCSVVSDSLRSRELQHAQPPCPSPTPGVYSDSCPLSRWCHSTISPSVFLFSSCPQSFSASGFFPSIRVLSNESVLPIKWPKNWSFSFNISPSNEYSGLISFRMDWLDLLAVQGTLKSLLQHHSSKASILQDSAFFIVRLSHLYMTTRKNHSFEPDTE